MSVFACSFVGGSGYFLMGKWDTHNRPLTCCSLPDDSFGIRVYRPLTAVMRYAFPSSPHGRCVSSSIPQVGF